MRKESIAFLERLLTTASPSGFEEQVQALCRSYVEPFVDTVYKDVHGNQYAVRNPKGKPRIMLAGHVDEIALMVNHIDERGFIGFVAIGGVDAAILEGQRVVVHGTAGPAAGVIGRKAIHLTDPDERNKALKMHQMWVDIGAKDRKDAQKVAAIGDPITIDVGFTRLRGDRVVARALDDRVGAFVCLEVMRALAKRKAQAAVYCVTTVQEEIGLRGATTSAYGCDPQAGLAVEVGHATDHPGVEASRYGATTLDGGPILSRGANINPVVARMLSDVARKHDIPVQMTAAPRVTGTDAAAMQISREGVATGVVGVPTRYMHSPVEMVSLGDVSHAVNLITEWVCAIKPDTSFIP